jgi:hypothetical protein
MSGGGGNAPRRIIVAKCQWMQGSSNSDCILPRRGPSKRSFSSCLPEKRSRGLVRLRDHQHQGREERIADHLATRILELDPDIGPRAGQSGL